MFSSRRSQQPCNSLRARRCRSLSGEAIAAVALITLAGVALLTVAGSSLDRPASADSGAMASTRVMVNRAVEILGNRQLSVQQRRRALREVIEPRFDFTQMSRTALGYHWRELNPAQRAEFTRLFSAFLEDAYLSKIQDYAGQQVNFVKQSSIGDGYEQISTLIVQPNNKASIPVNYLVEPEANDWKIYDVTVDNISIIANYRNQFNRVINERGFEQLMADLKSKEQQLASLLGE